jgi:tagaturonate epimerase
MEEMEGIARLLVSAGLADADQRVVSAVKALPDPLIEGGGRRIYRQSLQLREGTLYFVAGDVKHKSLYAAGSSSPMPGGFHGTTAVIGGVRLLCAGFSAQNARVLHDLFPFTAPVSLREKTTTIGCGDRLGRATPGHIRALRGYAASPVLAQQSVRELALTHRDFPGVVADASFLVFQEGFEDGYGADGDHLKSLGDIDTALDAGMPMITLDLTEVMNAAPAEWSAARVDAGFDALDVSLKERVRGLYEGRHYELPGCRVSLTVTEARRCALMYSRALDFAADVDRHLGKRRGSAYDLEVSIDETTTPTLPSHHLFIASELERRGVAVTSIAPRFVGEFQKGIDYIGDLREFEAQFSVHCAIARARGNYKISIHSGSDKFSVYPAIGRHTGMRLHLKTAGTSWLQALRVVARTNAPLFRRVVTRAIEWFPEAAKLYHVTAEPSRIPAPDSLAAGDLEKLLDAPDSRQVLHITYGGILGDPSLREEFFTTLDTAEDDHQAAVQEHIEKHVSLLGVPRVTPRAGQI